ncbi:ABC transporter ATP-binding protein [Vallicoccus soli]|uniref:ABC transporter ATP-binding protein n=1 Tax=Vallicoccus soli TaxID=2339232 RepID=A0A3A3Z4B4_9ACTN|nr:ABC transporter ATP-binding protein [Vallicoccus soli]RJK98272.1 ABC transporter ATP-binding protein [Vallicoccus soli]
MTPPAPAAPVAGTDVPALAVRDLAVRFPGRRGRPDARVVNGISYDVRRGETLAVVGESGSGKTVSVLSMLGLVPGGAEVTGRALLDGRDLLAMAPEELRRVRGPGVGVVFQDPMTSLNPVLTVGRQLTEGMQEHLGLSGAAARERALDLLGRVGIPDPRRRLDEHPHQLSGGMRQRVMIAIGISCDPDVLVADEATTALDVTVQAQILELVADLQRELGTAVVWITHDLGVVAGIADRVVVMYAGRVVEDGPVEALFDDPRHPYTVGLLGSLPVLGREDEELAAIPGLPPDPARLPPGCAFRPRCPVAAAGRGDARCDEQVPPLRPVGPAHAAATFCEVRR